MGKLILAYSEVQIRYEWFFEVTEVFMSFNVIRYDYSVVVFKDFNAI